MTEMLEITPSSNLNPKNFKTTIAFFWCEGQATPIIKGLLDEMVNSGKEGDAT